MNKNLIYPILVVILSLGSCNKKANIEGLWEVRKVSVGDDAMTPDARWMRFRADSTQESGNGWLRHSYGTWSMNEKAGELTVHNTNGITDPYGPFNITVQTDTMFWRRQEEGQQVDVLLVRTDSLPATYGNRLLGLWKLEQAAGEGRFFEPTDQATESDSYIFFRWDGIFVAGSGKGRFNGVYNVNGHRPELELIPYGEEVIRNFWEIGFMHNRIKLNLLNSDSNVVREFVRTQQFPD